MRRSHQLIVSSILPNTDSPDLAVLGSADSDGAALAFVPDEATDDAVARETIRVGSKNKRLSIGAVEVEKTNLLLVTTRQEILSLGLRVEGNGTDNVVVRERVEGLARVGVPDFAAMLAISPLFPARGVTPTPRALATAKSLTQKSRHCPSPPAMHQGRFS